MRSVRVPAALGWIVFILVATVGFAAYSTRGDVGTTSGSGAASSSTAPPPVASGRIGAFLLAEALVPEMVMAPTIEAADVDERIGTGGRTLRSLAVVTTTSSTTTTTAPPQTTTTTAPPETTTTAPPETTTTAPPETTTTAPPETTTTAPPETTTTAPPETTTTAPPETTTTTVLPDTTEPPMQPASVEAWRGLVAVYFPAERVDEALTVMRCESRGDPEARNSYSGAAGLFQFMPATWSQASDAAGFGGVSVYDPEANIAAAAWLVQSSIATGHGGGPWGHWSPVCRP